MFSDKLYEKWVVVRKRTCYLKLSPTCTANHTTCIFSTETPTYIVTIKIVTHIFAAKTVTCICAAETSNCIIATEALTYIITPERSTNLTAAEITTCIIAVELQNLHNCNRRHLYDCYRKCQLHSSNRNSLLRAC